MDNSIQYGISYCRLTDKFMPFGHGVLARKYGRLRVVAILQNLKEVLAFHFVKLTPVVNEEHVYSGIAVEELKVKKSQLSLKYKSDSLTLGLPYNTK